MLALGMWPFAAEGFNVADGPARVDLAVAVPIANGALTKTGAGALQLQAANTFTGGTTVQSGLLDLSGSLNSGVTVAGGVLAFGTVTGLQRFQ